MQGIKKIKKVNISDEVYNQIKENIISQFWIAGEKIPSETKLAESFGVSRSSVRIALSKLTTKGLIKTCVGEGSFVVDVSIGDILNPLIDEISYNHLDIIEMFEFRKPIEMLSCSLAASRSTDEEIEILKEIVNKMRKYKEENNIDKYTLYDMNFHIQISIMSKNTLIQKVLSILREFIVAHVFKMNIDVGMDFGFDYHVKILEAIVEKNPKKAEKLMENNMIDNINVLKKNI